MAQEIFSNATENKKSKKKVWLAIFIPLLILILAGGAVAAVFLMKKQQPVVTDIVLTTSVSNITYNETFNKNAVTFRVVYDDNSVKNITMNEVTISAEDEAKLVLVGTHEIKVTYETVSKVFTFVIVPADMQGVTFTGKTVPFNDNYYVFAVSGITDAYTVKYYVNDSQAPVSEVRVKNAGVYEIRAVVSRPNYNDLELQATFEIVSYNIDGITGFTYNSETLTFSKTDIRNDVASLDFDTLIEVQGNVQWELYADADLSQKLGHTYTFDREGLHEIYLKVFSTDASTSIVYKISMYKYHMFTYEFLFKGERIASGVVEETFTVDAPDFSREGYIVHSWLVNGSPAEFPYTVLSNVTFIANYSMQEYAIAYEGLEGVDQQLDNPTNYTIETENFVLKNPTKKGYTFLGWKEIGVDDEPVLQKTISKGSIGNKTIQAVWEKDIYTIAYLHSPEAGEGEMINNENVVTYDVETDSFVLKAPTREGYTFVGWSGTGIVGMQQEVTIQKGTTGNLQFTANWELTEYTITYEYDPIEQTYDHVTNTNPTTYTIVTDTITLIDPERTGYIFLGWVDKETQAEPQKNITIEKGSTGNKTFIAKWEVVTYNITYKHDPVEEVGFDEIVNNNASQYVSYNINTETFSLSQPTRKGYTFVGWSGTGISGVQKDVTVEQGSYGNKTFNAHWQLTTYAIIFENNPESSGDVVNNNATNYTFTTETFTLQAPTRKGYIFKGWTYSGVDVPTKEVTIERGSTGEKTFTAVWEIEEYTIRYEHTPSISDSEEVTNANPTSYNVATETFTLSALERNGYTFVGWLYDEVEEPQMVVQIEKGSTGDVTLTAVWEPITYHIYYTSTPDSTGDDDIIDYGSTKDTYTMLTETFVLPTPTRTGYTFIGWSGTGIEGITDTVTIEKGSYGDKYFTANWEIQMFTYTFKDANGGVFKQDTIPYKTAIVAPESNPIKNSTTSTSYMFSGWDKEIPEYIVENIEFIPQYTEEQFSEGLLFELVDDAYVVSIGSAQESDILIPTHYNGLEVTKVKQQAFMSSNITSVTLPDTVVEIGSQAFKDCTNLTTVRGMENVATLSQEAFANCVQLNEIVLGDALIVIGNYALAGCTGLTALHIPAQVVAIELHALDGLTSMTSYTVDSANKNYTAYEGNLYSKDMSVLIKYAMGKDQATFVLPSLTIAIAENAFDADNGGVQSFAVIALQNIILHENVMYMYDTSLPVSCHIFSYATQKPETWSANSVLDGKVSWLGEWSMSGGEPVITASAFKTGVYTNWMSYISDETNILSTVMPGAHDAGTVGMGDWYRTQNSGFYDMLCAGTRYFDMRVKDDNGLKFIHGNTNSTGQTGMLFEDGLNDIKKFIEENPSEVLILDFQHTWDGSEDAVIAMLTEILGTEHMLKKSQAASLENLTMGQLRDWGINYIVTYRTESKCTNNDFLYFREANLYSPYEGGQHQNGNDALLSQMDVYIRDYTGTDKIFVLQSQRTGSVSNLNIQELEQEFRAAGNAYNRSLALPENVKKLNKINVIMRDFVADDVGAETAQQTIQSILFLNIAKGNIHQNLLNEFKTLLGYDSIIALM